MDAKIAPQGVKIARDFAVNILDKNYSERGGASDQAFSRAGVRGELSTNDPAYYYTYHFIGKPRSFWLQYAYQF